jgi:phage repressor protein C with HTH and peptisase S24 domain
MSPTIQDGDFVMVDTGRKRLYDGYEYALAVGDNISIKRLGRLAEGRIRVISDNRVEYPPHEIHPNNLRAIARSPGTLTN